MLMERIGWTWKGLQGYTQPEKRNKTICQAGKMCSQDLHRPASPLLLPLWMPAKSRLPISWRSHLHSFDELLAAQAPFNRALGCLEEQASPLTGKLLSFTGVEPIVDELSAVNSVMAFDASSEALCGASSRASPPQRFKSTDLPIDRQAEWPVEGILYLRTDICKMWLEYEGKNQRNKEN